MYRHDRNNAGLNKQRGTTLILALILILLATLLALFAMNVGLVGQRTSANDVRSRLVQQAAEGALAQGIEYLNLNGSNALDITNTANWERCEADDTSFPCGAVPVCAPKIDTAESKGYVSDGLNGCTGDLIRRGNMYRFIGGAAVARDVNGNGSTDDTMDKRTLPIDRQLTTVGGTIYNVNYGVGAVLCMVKTPNKSTDPTECTTDTTLATGTNVITLVATSGITGENARTTVTTTIGRSSSLFAPTNKPPVVASGTITTNGNFQIVTNPNSGGTGVPVSMWTREAVDKTGTPNTCYLDGFIHGSSDPIYEGTGSSKIITCDSCTCNSADALSFPSSGNKSQQGIDILDVDPATPQCLTTELSTGCKPNLDVQPGDFPCDLFEFVFGDKAWTDTDNDFFCESRLTAEVTGGSGTTYIIGEDENYLLAKATYILPNNKSPYYSDLSSLTQATILNSCNDILDSSGKIDGGMIWDQQGCGFKNQVGSADKPVVLIEDGDVSINAGGRMFGLLFVRPALYGATNGPDATPPYDANILDPATGAVATGLTGAGTANLSENGHAVIYGSVVIQGTANKINGTGAIVYNQTVLETLGKEDGLNKISPVPGSWSDRYAY